MEWRCDCGNTNREEARFCNQCGAPRPFEAASAPQAPVAPPAAGGAPRAGEEAPAPPAGGEPVETPPAAAAAVAPPLPSAQAVPAAPAVRKSKAPLIIGIVALVVLLGACVLGIIAAIAIPNFVNARERARQARAMGEIRSIAGACQAYAAANGSYPDTGHNQDSYYTIVDATDLEGLLAPSYVKALPVKDPWGHPYRYGVSADDKEFVVICSGSDGETTVEAIPSEPVGTKCFEDDIVWENDGFVQSPSGPQKRCGKGR